jgi:Holliday junction resolvase
MAYLEITLKVSDDNRPAAAKVYNDYKETFLNEVKGAQSKDLLIREDDVQVLHGFATVADAQAYIKSDHFLEDVGKGLAPYLESHPEVRIYDVA